MNDGLDHKYLWSQVVLMLLQKDCDVSDSISAANDVLEAYERLDKRNDNDSN